MIAWSGIFVRLAELPPATSAFLRCAYAVPLLAGLAWYRVRSGRASVLTARQRAWGVAAGLCFGADLLLWHVSIGSIGAGLATLLGNTQVLIVPLAAWALWRERPGVHQLAALPLLAAGVLLIAGVGSSSAFGGAPLLGALTGGLTGVAYAGFLLCLRAGRVGAGEVPVGALAISTCVAALVAAVAGGLTGTLDLKPSWPAHGWMVLLAVLCQVLAWLLIATSLVRIEAARVSMVLLLQPVAALVLGVLVLAEAPSVLQWVGATIVLIGIAAGAPRRTAPEPVQPAQPA